MKYFDKIFVINLDNEIGHWRLSRFKVHFEEHDIEFERWEGTENSNGAIGLLYSYLRLFAYCIKNEWTNVLIFEDDARMVVGFWPFIDEIWTQLPYDYHCLYLGINLHEQPARHSANLLKIKSAYASHAIVYSLAAMRLIVDAIKRNPYLTYDIMLMKEIQPLGKSYCTYPQLCFQRPGVSHIEKDFKDWSTVSAETFSRYTKNL